MKVLFSFISIVFILSCSNTREEEPLSEEVIRSNIYGKWLVEDSDLFLSFDFNNSKTCLIQKLEGNTVDYYYTSYLFENDNLVFEDESVMSNFEFSSGNSFEFTLTKNFIDYALSANLDESHNVQESPTNDAFTRSWQLEYLDGISVEELNIDLHIFFSISGTYYVNDFIDTENSVLRYWQWSDIDGDIFCSSIVEDFECEDEANYVRVDYIDKDTLIFSDFIDPMSFKFSSLE